MESEHLTAFMQTTEIQEIAERHAQFEKYIEKRGGRASLNDKMSRNSVNNIKTS